MFFLEMPPQLKGLEDANNQIQQARAQLVEACASICRATEYAIDSGNQATATMGMALAERIRIAINAITVDVVSDSPPAQVHHDANVPQSTSVKA